VKADRNGARVASAKIAKHTFPFAAKVAAVTCTGVFGVVSADAQATTAADASPSFEVASIRPADLNERNVASPRSWGEDTGKVTLGHVPLKTVLLHVYDLQPDQLSGPAWLDDRLFDIVANAPAGASRAQIALMFQTLLRDRFKLVFHRETKMLPVFALMVRKGGPALKESLPDTDSVTPPASPQTEGQIRGKNSGESMSLRSTGGFGKFKMTMANGNLHYEYESMTSKNLADFLNQGLVDLPVIDMTGLKASYQISLDVPVGAIPGNRPQSDSGDATHPPTASDPTGNSIFTSLEKLGLTLIRQQTLREKFVVDHIENTPTPN
jgi:uncharacterized protein (TIGR03435 family)